MKRILTTLSQKWPEYLLEMIVITAGIIGAFGLSNWNESVSNQERAMKLLHSLKAEFQTNQEQLATVMKHHLDVEKSSTELLRSVNNNERLSEDSLKYHFIKISKTWTFDPQNSVLRSSISSGDIHLIKNDALLNHLFGWTDLVMDAQEDEVQAKEQYTNSILPLSFEYIMETDLIAEYSEIEEFESRYTSDYSGLIYNRKFENLIALRLENTLGLLLELRPIQVENEAILSQIDKSLNNTNE